MERWSNSENLTEITEKKREINRNRIPLPIDEYRDQIIEQIRINPTTIVIGETGSGKTTEIPGFLLDEFPDKKIVITEPRRIATRSVAEYVAKKRGVQIGEEEIGYRMRFEDVSSEETMANFLTDGILLQEIKNDPLLLKYEIIMIDEAHERSLNIDFLLGLLKKAQTERKEKGEKELKIIVTSATLEKEKFTRYFDNSGAIEVPGRTFDVSVKNREVNERDTRGNLDYTLAAASVVREIVESKQTGDILIFMPRQQEILNTIENIKRITSSTNLEILPLYGVLPPEEQQKVFQSFAGKRKVIVATNIAETSITIDGVRFVIDSGLINEKDFNPDTGIESQEVRRHARSGCTQRKGRAGRTAPGTCYRLYSEEDHEEREDFQRPEIARSNLDHVVLTMKKIGINDVANFDFIDPPKKEAIEQAIETLKTLNALDEEGNITEIGDKMSELPLKPELARMLIEAEKYGCTESICTIVAMIGEKSIFVRPKDLEVEADMAHERFKIPDSDFITLLNVWEKWKENGFDYKWTKDNFLNFRQLSEAREVRYQLMRKLGSLGIPVIDNPTDNNTRESIEKAVCAGMIKNLMTSNFSRGYSKLSDSPNGGLYEDKIYPHPSSTLFHNSPTYMIGANVVKTSKSFARLCQRVEEEWIPELAPHLLVAENTVGEIYYNSNNDSVGRTRTYHFKKNPYIKISSIESLTNKEEASKVFIEALIGGNVYNEIISENNNKIKILKKLYNRSGGRIQVPDLEKFYSEKLKGVTNNAQLSKIPEEDYTIDLDKYYSVELRRELDEKFPTTFTVRGRNLDINYFYESAKDSEYSLEKYEAYIIIPSDLQALSINEIPQIGENEKPRIFFQVSNYGYIRPELYLTLGEVAESILPNYREPVFSSISEIHSQKGDQRRSAQTFEVNAFDRLGLEKVKKVKKSEEPKAEKIPKPELFETVMTDSLREKFNTQAEEFEFLLEILKETINNVEYKNEKTEKIKNKLKEITKKLKNDIAEIKESSVLTKIRGLIGSVSGEIQRIIKDFEKLEIFSNGWNDRYTFMMEKIKETALKEGLEITKENLPLIRKKIGYLATKEILKEQIDAEIENIVVEMI